ncbi:MULTISPECIES: ImmA/IrrE family metallo-endopeptidase [Rhizobium]|uniref:ImmA/IrrE family metallo-endopeptidase n=1 Tax=Rhizobium phaseoli TaxID=396 RepID=UPI000A1EB1B6|nr:ImmA/IrrE family metallo-endopeptidase [Rhizobium phaseoli]
MRRGFKAESERRAIAARQSLGLVDLDVLDPWLYADYLGVIVLDPRDLPLEPEHLEQLLERDPDSWSGMTLFEDGEHVVVLNTSHGKPRQRATLMHELAHIILDHPPADVDVSPSGLVLLSDYSVEQEEEADWLGGALLLPEPAILHHRTAGHSIASLSQIYGISVELCTWRCRMTGVEKRLAFRKRA